jgi:hypothetical protein
LGRNLPLIGWHAYAFSGGGGGGDAAALAATTTTTTTTTAETMSAFLVALLSALPVAHLHRLLLSQCRALRRGEIELTATMPGDRSAYDAGARWDPLVRTPARRWLVLSHSSTCLLAC